MTVINGTEDDIKRQREAMEERRLKAKQAKMAKVSRQEQPMCSYMYTRSENYATKCGNDLVEITSVI